MEILNGVEVRLGEISQLASSGAEPVFVQGYQTCSIPVVIGDIDDRLWQLIHIYLLEKASAGLKDLQPKARAFLSWLKFIQHRGINPFSSPRMRQYHPTYAYRAYLRSRVDGEATPGLSGSTASAYMNVIRAFYEFLIGHGVIEGEFFKYKNKRVPGYRQVKSTDLAIRIPRKHGSSLNPLEESQFREFLALLDNCTVEYKLMMQLMVLSGFRVGEACSVTARVFDEDSVVYEGRLARGIYIGPSFNVQTKFGVTREAFITDSQFNDIRDYIESDRYSVRLSKWRSKYSEESMAPLFLSESGNPLSSQTFYSYWYRFKGILTSEVKGFDHKPHDLRATFATNFLSLAIRRFPDKVDECLETVKTWMGHKSISTTLKYIGFINKREVSDGVALIMDDFISGVFSDE